MTFIIKQDRIYNGYDGTQKEILAKFNLKFHRRSRYILDDEYDIVFIAPLSDKWKNHLSKDQTILYESSLDRSDLDTKNRSKKRITFIRDSHGYGTYSFIGVFILDNSYDWKLDTYPTGKMMDPRLKYIRIAEEFTI